MTEQRPVVFLFAGQGSQYHQMGRALFEHEPVFARTLRSLDAMVVDLTGSSVLERMYDEAKGIADPFDRLADSHPAIFMVEYALSRLLVDRGIVPDHVLGTSLGEFVAAAVAGVLPVEDLLRTVVAQARLAERHCPPGRMLAVLHDPGLFTRDPQLWAGSELVSVNYDEHFVVAGAPEPLMRIKRALESMGIAAEPLPVPHAFHSSHIDGFEAGFKDLFGGLEFQPPTVPLVSGVHATRRDRFDAGYFWDVVRRPIQFPGALRLLAGEGEHTYLDLSPGGTLAGFATRILGADADCHPILSPFQQDRQLLAEVESIRPRAATPPAATVRGPMTAFLFPGQGSQSKGMGAGLFEEFAALTAIADKVLGYSIEQLCVEDPDRNLGRTQFTQPALYVVEALTYLKRMQGSGARPDYLAGHSLGEYVALFAAGAFDFETGLRLVRRRGELMSRAPAGGMAAVIGLTVDEVRDVLSRDGLSRIDVANHNAPRQVVVAGPRADISVARSAFERAGAQRYVPLNVSGAFHSRLMRATQEELTPDLERVDFRALEVPVVANVSARPYRPGETAATLAAQITSRVCWNDTIRYLLAVGVTSFEEIGPGAVLAQLVAKIGDEAEPLVIEPAPPARPSPASTRPAPAARIVAEHAATPAPAGRLTAHSLGSEAFRRDYNLRYAYASGGMYRGIASADLVIRMGKAGMLGFFGTAMLRRAEIEPAIRRIQQALPDGAPYGVNLVHSPADPAAEESIVDLCLTHRVRVVEASAFMSVTPALVRYRAKGLRRGADGEVVTANKIVAKLSRPEVAQPFLSPAPGEIAEQLAASGAITAEEAALVRTIPMAEDICVEADSGGHTDRGVLAVILPAIRDERDRLTREHGYPHRVRVGAAGGLGSPAAAAAAFVLGADFILTGSINQCTAEAGMSDAVKDMLQQAGVHDTAYAPAGDMFEIGAQVQVLQKGVFFPGRSNRLYQLYKHFDSLEDIDEKTRTMIEEKYFRRGLDEVYEDVKAYQPAVEIERAERNPKYKMALVFKWYFAFSTQAALNGDPDRRVDYQVHCGPALGGMNEWLKGTQLEHWRDRHADELGVKLLTAAAELIEERFAAWFSPGAAAVPEAANGARARRREAVAG